MVERDRLQLCVVVVHIWQKFEASIQRLQQAGYRRDAVTIMNQQSDYLIALADATADLQTKHAHYLEVRSSLKTLTKSC